MRWRTGRPGRASRRSAWNSCPARVAGRERLGGLKMALAPVRAAAVASMISSTPAEVGLPVELAVLVDGDVADVAGVGGAEDDVVGGREADLDRERDPDARDGPASASTRRTASAACSRGIAYSISVNLIRRSEAKTRKLRSTLVGARCPRAASRDSRGTCDGNRRAASANSLPDPVLEHHLLRVDARRVARAAAARQCAGSRGRAPSRCAGRRRTRSGRVDALSLSRRARVSASGRGRSMRSSVKAGTTRTVTA